MAYIAKKTEHAGAKKGRGAYYGRKAEAKKASNRRRRQEDKRAALTNRTGYRLIARPAMCNCLFFGLTFLQSNSATGCD
jgi:hypothetical protein